VRAVVYLLSARFPGPTAPRDFVTQLLSSDTDPEHEGNNGRPQGPRQFMVVSKPCVHPQCPQRQGFIRGQYESVEIIRELPVKASLRRTQSSVEISRDEGYRSPTGTKPGNNASFSSPPLASSRGNVGGAGEEYDEPEMAIEWLMITRSDPGGSVPRFMVEKGTPGGIVSDTGRFVKWLSAKSAEDFASDEGEDEGADEVKEEAVAAEKKSSDMPRDRPSPGKPSRDSWAAGRSIVDNDDTGGTGEEAMPSGFYGMIAGALGAAGIAGSAMVNRLSTFAGPYLASGSEGMSQEDETDDDTASDMDYASAEEGDMNGDATTATTTTTGESMGDKISTHSAMSVSEGTEASHPTLNSTPTTPTTKGPTILIRHEKELKKLQERWRKAQDKVNKTQQRAFAAAAKRRQEDRDKENSPGAGREGGGENEAAAAKLREKHERELARQQERYLRDVRRLEEKRATEERRMADRRRKAIEREEKAGGQAELEKVRAERDLARKRVELLTAQVGELQAQNTMLVAKLGRAGLGGAGTSSGESLVAEKRK
jgi:hypothetical protein